ncbi:hypothetical protein DNTS_004891 [Danionella cerebrum]|uniref:Uncharacterized protein n=1 Tax=Danionella cerebrum TaxID=2873325 RepID=A0A553MQK5_9TELE|nr:hypothetical protein DNTS_004891 [Danionella translucida]
MVIADGRPAKANWKEHRDDNQADVFRWRTINNRLEKQTSLRNSGRSSPRDLTVVRKCRRTDLEARLGCGRHSSEKTEKEEEKQVKTHSRTHSKSETGYLGEENTPCLTPRLSAFLIIIAKYTSVEPTQVNKYPNPPSTIFL